MGMCGWGSGQNGFQRCCGGGGVVVKWVPALWGWWGSGKMGSSAAVGVVG